MENFGGEKPAEETIRKLSKTVLHAAERRRQSLFERLTAANMEKIAELSQEKPIFYENKEDAPQTILLDDKIAKYLPQKFFDDPTKWIENQENIGREQRLETLPTGEIIEELWGEPYDISKVKEFNLVDEKGKKITIVSKRMDKNQLEEVALARKAWEAGIPTAQVFGEIYNKGNAYVFFERIKGINFLEARDRLHLLMEREIPPSFSISEEKFDRWMQDEYIYNIITDKGKKKLYSLWEEMMPTILRREAVSFLYDNLDPAVRFFEGNGEDLAKEHIENLKMKINGKEMLLQKEIDVVLDIFNYSDYIQFLDHCLNLMESGKKEEFSNIFFQLRNEHKNLNAKIKIEFDEVFIAEIYKDIFGFKPYEEIEKLKKLCEEKGIEHKDFNDRNILVEWDFKKNRPLRKKENDKNKMYIIDWEPKNQRSK